MLYINGILINGNLGAWEVIFVVFCAVIAIKFLSEILKGLK